MKTRQELIQMAIAALKEPERLGQVSKYHELIKQLTEIASTQGNLVPLLGALIHVKNRPFTEKMFTQFEPLFNINMPLKTILKCGRQVSKSTNLAAKILITSACIPHFQTLVVTPQFEMTRRFSANYIRPQIENSPLSTVILDTRCEKSVLQKTLANHAMIHFSYAFLDANRARGIGVDHFVADELQDIDYAFIPELEQTMSRSDWRIETLSGTAKTFDNGLEVCWDASSRAEWLIPCNCGYINNPHVAEDGIKMIGLKTLVCAKCNKPLNSSSGYWYHFNKTKRFTAAGWHVPQIILPFHYEDPRRWKIITDAKNGEISKRLFYNEILGESCDVGAKLLTESDLQKASVLPVNMDLQGSRKHIKSYAVRALGVDWGGRGEDTDSFTKLAIMGMRPDGCIDLLYGENLSRLADAGEEVSRVIDLYNLYGCHMLAHDAAGTAGMRDSFLSHAGFPMNVVMPMCYVSVWSKNIIAYHESTASYDRPYYSVDKTKSLLVIAECIKNRIISFPNYNSCKDLVKDFLALVEERTESSRGSDIYLIRRAANRSDDFAHAVNFAAVALFHTQSKWPNLVNAIKSKSATLKQIKALHPDNPTLEDWENDTEYLQ